MQRLVVCLLALLGTILALNLQAQEPDQKSDKDQLIGVWQIVSGEIKGQVRPAPEGNDDTFTFTADGGMQRKAKERVAQAGEWAINEAPDPAEMDFITKENEKVVSVIKCIYRLTDDTLAIAFPYDQEKGERPTDFDSQKAMIMNLKRRATAGGGDTSP
jgi:uncharacterized protein (TIGR03067 family)